MGGQAQDGQEPSQPSAERNRHKSLPKQHVVLSRKLRRQRITGNAPGLARSFIKVSWQWRKWLGRRNRSGRDAHGIEELDAFSQVRSELWEPRGDNCSRPLGQ